MQLDYYFENKEPVVYEVKDGKLGKPLRGVVRRIDLVNKKAKRRYEWAQVINGKIVAVFKSNELSFMKKKAG